ncbi:peptidase family A16 [Ancylostoma caninum]|uniref:Peptidase family A16 n=1 Tax=Ancylostoma caninum TaxID=29170 RepID=A0A368GE17_ANCCA|nr:peptidase family A16 [Ancylostoma caninum]
MQPVQYLKLPKFELPDFSGDMNAFPEFWDLFSAALHNNPSVPPALKFLHLKSKLKGNAKELIAAVHLTENNYQETVSLLLNTYNRPDILRNRLWEELEALPQSSDTPITQRTTLCKIKAIWVQLKKLEEQPDATGTMRLIRSKFPLHTREKIGELRKRDDHWTVEELLSALDKVIDQFEIMEDTDPHTTLASSVVHSVSQHDPRKTDNRPH